MFHIRNQKLTFSLPFLLLLALPFLGHAQFTQGQISIGTWSGGGNYAAVAHRDLFSQPNSYALLQQATGNTFINAKSGKKIFFRIGNQNGMVLSNNRRLGIGTAAPTDKLHVEDATNPAIKLSGSGNTAQLAMATANGFYAPGATAGDLVMRSLSDDVTLYSTNGDIRFLTEASNGNNEKMVVKSDGKVGVGVANPLYDLDVDGTVRASDGIRFSGTTAPEAIVTNEGLQFEGGAIFVGRQNLMKMNFFRQQVNIGTGTQPWRSGYLLTVDGKVLVEELKVQNSSNWPDYVFEEDYDLADLSTVESYINEHKHLPEVPAASELTDGVEIGEMQKTLLKKVEELTLYMIDLNKTVAEQQEKIADLEAQNSALQAETSK